MIKFLVTPLFSQVAHIISEVKNEKYDWKFRGNSLKEIQPIINGLKKLSQELLERNKKIQANTLSLEEQNKTLSDEIDRREKAETALKKSEQKLRLVISQSPIGICTVDLNGNILSTNQAYEQILGYSRDELRELSLFDITHPDDCFKNRKLFQDMCSRKTPGFDIEKRYIRKNGTEINVYLHATAVKDEEGNTVFGTAFIEDITARKHAEREILQSKLLIESVINGIADPVFVKDEKHRWIMLNDAFCRVFCKTCGELLGKSDYDFFPEKEARLFWEHDDIVFTSNKPDINEEHIVIGEETRIVSTNKSPFTNPITGARNLVATLRDITDTKRLEEQFNQAQKMESVGRLAGGVAHDFNNMLGVILGHTDIILAQLKTSQPFIDNLKEIKKAAERSSQLTRQLLAFARKQTVAPKVLDINKIVGGMTKMMRRLIGEDIDLVWDPCRDIWPVKIDPGQIDQILVNLCVNARDAIDDNGKLTIETNNSVFDEDYCKYHTDSKPGEYVMLAVSDNGCGINREIIDNIFEPFFTTKKTGVGTGLGLATVFGIVKQNNGFINVYSEPDKGSTFKIYLPRYLGDESQTIRKEIPVEQTIRNGETILLVEDEPAILEMTTMMLEGLGYTVMAAATPGEALRFVEEYPKQIQLLMTDVIMPEMNGKELAKNILARYPDLKRLFMSGYTADVIAHHGVLDEGVHFIQKPFSIQDLATKLREVLES
ncbi:PAS domain S-box protein [Desulforhopalus vacuolatus]|uniref:PAS domain S-box protein n=1 Tax=Desulforhopalus vacuolatus TaxID=40414 RepID=UPI001965F783|nr:PAS domain S-box protein [Desulforhopalus vacuolatus]MBM9521004.1 PAS domain S-box protein [Desulforhopalus vacuolatus]